MIHSATVIHPKAVLICARNSVSQSCDLHQFTNAAACESVSIVMSRIASAIHFPDSIRCTLYLFFMLVRVFHAQAACASIIFIFFHALQVLDLTPANHTVQRTEAGHVCEKSGVIGRLRR